jgi:hypothetical protein
MIEVSRCFGWTYCFHLQRRTWRWRQYVPLNSRYSYTKLHSVRSLRTFLFQLPSRVSTPAEGTTHSVIHLFLEGWCPSYSFPLLSNSYFPLFLIDLWIVISTLLCVSCLYASLLLFLSVLELQNACSHEFFHRKIALVCKWISSAVQRRT